MLKLPTPISDIIELHSDFPLDFGENPVSGDLLRVVNEESIKQSIRNLIMTNRGERPFQPDLGSDLKLMLFEQNTPDQLLILKEKVRDVISTYEPRASIVDIIVYAVTDSNEVSVQITFYVLNRQDPVVLTLSLERVR